MVDLTPNAPDCVLETNGTMHHANCDPVGTGAHGQVPVGAVGASCVANAVFTLEMIVWFIRLKASAMNSKCIPSCTGTSRVTRKSMLRTPGPGWLLR